MSNPQATRWLRSGCVLGFIGVAAGAFGAHALEGQVTVQRAEVWSTAARYLMYHAPPLLLVGLLRRQSSHPGLDRAASAFVLGTAIFSGSLFALVLADLPILGALTPLGGLSLLAGWALLAHAVGHLDAS
jgi:uncharacterized membrane protein YgdD (TMEM256/DUF423 family)